MTRLRRAIGPIIAAWLVCQATTLALTPALLAFSLACGCATGANATCPMHHSTQPTPGSGTKCTLQNAHAPLDTALLSLFASHGVVPQKMSVDLTDTTFRRIFPVVSELASRTGLPDSPPPRA